MPLYTYRCLTCENSGSYISKVADRANTPKCEECDSVTEKLLDSPMVGAMGIADHAAVRSPIDGSMLYGRSDYKKHMAKHGVVPLSDVQGEAKHQKDVAASADKKLRKETIINTVKKLNG